MTRSSMYEPHPSEVTAPASSWPDTGTAAGPPAGFLPGEELRAILDEAVCREVARKGRVEAWGEYWVIVGKGKPIDHAFHAIASVVTCWLWSFFIWLPCVLFGGERRITLTVEPDGTIYRRVQR